MNRNNRHERMELDPCPHCGHGSGERLQNETPPFLYYVRCAECGAITHGYKSKSCATKAWQKGHVI